MKREELVALGLTEEQVAEVMKQHGLDIQAEQAKLTPVQQALDKANSSLKAFEGVDVDALKKEIDDLKNEKATYLFDSKIKDAITAAGGRSVKAISALLDIDTLKALTEGQDDAINKAVEDAKTANGWAFTTEGKPSKEEPIVTVKTGDEHGSSGDSGLDGVLSAFQAKNPKLKF